MRKLELCTERTKLVLPNIDEAAATLDYYVKNRDHLRPTEPRIPAHFFNVDYRRERLQENLRDFESDKTVRFFIELVNAPKEFIGVVNFTRISRGPSQSCSLGYSIAREHQGKGLMYEAIKVAIRFIFEDKHLHRIDASYLPDNKRSANLLKRLGFRVDGASADYLFINGAWREHVFSSLTNPSWTPREEDRIMFEA